MITKIINFVLLAAFVISALSFNYDYNKKYEHVGYSQTIEKDDYFDHNKNLYDFKSDLINKLNDLKITGYYIENSGDKLSIVRVKEVKFERDKMSNYNLFLNGNIKFSCRINWDQTLNKYVFENMSVKIYMEDKNNGKFSFKGYRQYQVHIKETEEEFENKVDPCIFLSLDSNNK